MQQPLQIRPRFRLISQLPPHEILGKIQAKLSQPGSQCEGTVSFHHAMLRMPDAVTHFWSPRLTVQVEECTEGSMLRCLFGPSPTVWTLFLAIYAAVGFLGLVALIWGLSQMSLGMSAGILWGVPAAVIVGLTAWLVAGYGQHLGKEQMVTLRFFLDEAIGDYREEPPN